MTGKNKASKWQDKQLRKLEILIFDQNFQNDLNNLPADHSAEDYISSLIKLCIKYNIQPGLVIKYLNNLDKNISNIPLDSIEPTFSIICDDDETSGPAESQKEAEYNYIVERKFPQPGINLYIPPGSGQAEITSFISKYWPYIESKIGRPDRIKRCSAAERNTKILSMHDEGYSNKDITSFVAANFSGNLIIDDIARIIRKAKK